MTVFSARDYHQRFKLIQTRFGFDAATESTSRIRTPPPELRADLGLLKLQWIKRYCSLTTLLMYATLVK